MPERRLLLARHATTAAYAPAGDASRPLLPAGEAQARLAGAWLGSAGLRPDLALVSSAQRAQETWAGVSAGLGAVDADQPDAAEVPAWTEDRIYVNDLTSLFAVLAEAPDEVATLLLVGHAPAVPALAYDLADSSSADTDRDALKTVVERYETMTIAELTLPSDIRWSTLAPGTAALRAIHRFPA